jgi:5-(carboxyamino)imidazole ribonucleotide mutase
MRVAIIMGSSSDMPIMKEAAEALDMFNIDYDFKVVSAHRTPEAMIDFAKNAKSNGYQVIVAGAGGAAHLPGMVASVTTLPVVGIPIKSSNSLDGWDSLLSIAQMPKGISVATMAVNGAFNGGLFAANILGSSNNDLSDKLLSYKNGLKDKVDQMNKDIV